ncbi:MAG: hypothetical protein ACYC0V_04250 [Armatimonadota bacterium]
MNSNLYLMVLVSTLSISVTSADPIRVADGKPLVGIYFFPHWWEPWKSSDDAVTKDLTLLNDMGYNTIFVDHQFSQMLDGDWKLLDRGHRLAKQTGISILPWLSPGVWGLGSGSELRDRAENMYGIKFDMGVDIDGKPNEVKPYDPAVIDFGVKYTSQYLDRYLQDGAILRVMWNGKLRPVVALSVEVKWAGSYDPLTEQMLRLWLRGRYGSDIRKLNRRWQTSYTGFEQVDLHDTMIFDINGFLKGEAKHPNAVEDHVEFRSQVIDNALAEMKRRLLVKYPDLLIATELPYQFAGMHPHAEAFRVEYGANPSAVRHADILVIRASDSLSPSEEKALIAEMKAAGQKVILTYRLSSGYWGPKLRADKSEYANMDRMFAKQAARIADGFGIYSWNEMVDPHVVVDPDPPLMQGAVPNTQADFDATIIALRRMAEVYIKAVD